VVGITLTICCFLFKPVSAAFFVRVLQAYVPSFRLNLIAKRMEGPFKL
jgi:hypothetical protein